MSHNVTVMRVKILVNLISNAIKYGNGSSVHIAARQCSLADALAEAQKAGVSDVKVLGTDLAGLSTQDLKHTVTVVSVRDHGRGIPLKEMESLFGEFVQLKVSEEMDRMYVSTSPRIVGQTSGSGLGLNLVLKLVTRMNGHVWAENSTTGGAVFSFCFSAGDAISNSRDEGSLHSSVISSLDLMETALDWLQVVVVDDSSKYTIIMPS